MLGNEHKVDLTKEFLSSRFSMKDIGEADVIFGIRIKHESNGIAISQSHYIEKVLKKFNYFDCTSVSTLIDTSLILLFVVGKLSRYTSNPGTQHWQAIQRVLKYLKKTIDYKLMYTGYPLLLEGYTDASWISNSKDNSSTSATGKEAGWLRNLILKIPLWSKPITPISIRFDCCDEVWSPSEHPEKKHNEETSTNLAWTEPGKYSGEAGMSKDTPGPESPGELRRSWYVEGHVRSGVVSPVLAQRYQRTTQQRYSPCQGPLSLE
ncbi:zinc finger, CCHC-type containing protein [Tanacetum coccineum]